MKASQTETVIMLTCCALQSACYSPTGIVISFILAQFQGEVQTNLTVKRFLMCSAALCTSIAEELFIISRLSRSAERSKRIFTGGGVTEATAAFSPYTVKRGCCAKCCATAPVVLCYIFSGTLILNMVSTLKMAFFTPMHRARRACCTAGSAP